MDATSYGYLLVGSIALVLLAAVGLVAHQVRRRRRFRDGLVGVVESQFEMALTAGESPLFHGEPDTPSGADEPSQTTSGLSERLAR
jgi:hypothetical protein